MSKLQIIRWRNDDGKFMECSVQLTKDSAKVTQVRDGREVKETTMTMKTDPVVPTIVKKDGKECTGCGLAKLKRLITGSVKLLKSELGIDGTSTDELEMRKKICLGCEFYDFGVCTDCGCFLSAKVRLKSESCPKGRW